MAKEKMSLKRTTESINALDTKVTKLDVKVNNLDTETPLKNHANDYTTHVPFGNSTGTNNYVVNLSTHPKSLVLGMGISFKVNNNATGNCTLNVNNLGVKNIVNSNGEIVKDLKKDSIYTVRYNGTSFTLQGESGGGNEELTAYKTFPENRVMPDDSSEVLRRVVMGKREYFRNKDFITNYSNSEFVIGTSRDNISSSKLNVYKLKVSDGSKISESSVYPGILSTITPDGNIVTLSYSNSSGFTCDIYNTNLVRMKRVQTVPEDPTLFDNSNQSDVYGFVFKEGESPSSRFLKFTMYNSVGSTTNLLDLETGEVLYNTLEDWDNILKFVPEYMLGFDCIPVNRYGHRGYFYIYDKDTLTLIRKFNSNAEYNYIDICNPRYFIEHNRYNSINPITLKVIELKSGKDVTPKNFDFFKMIDKPDGNFPIEEINDWLRSYQYVDVDLFRGISFRRNTYRSLQLYSMVDSVEIADILSYTYNPFHLLGRDEIFRLKNRNDAYDRFNSIDTRGLTMDDLRSLYSYDTIKVNDYGVSSTSIKKFKKK